MAMQMSQSQKETTKPRKSSGDAAAMGQPCAMNSQAKSQSLLQVLGIAMIVEERGAGARLVARYPTHPSAEEPQTLNSQSGTNESKSSQNGNINKANTIADDPLEVENMEDNDSSHANDLFFTLTARQMAKLFRTKTSLCNQPMTLRVNRTIFCCYAVLMDTEEHGQDAATHSADPEAVTTTDSNTGSELTHFSIVVALSASSGEAAVPFSNFWDGSSEDEMDLEQYLHHVATSTTKYSDMTQDGKKKKKKKSASRVSSAFLAIRRVHISLARVCRALEREEHRCRYVSLQSNAFFKIRNEQQKRWEEIALNASRASARGTMPHHHQPVSSSGSGMTSGKADSHPRKGRHARKKSFGAAASGAAVLDVAFEKLAVTTSVRHEQEKEQETLELMLALSPPARPPGLPRHHGNLVRELCSVYHALSRKDYEYPPTPATLLCEQDSVVYINQHLAIPIEAADLDSPPLPTSFGRGQFVQPYHTLLFPYASPSELLQTFLSSGSAAPQRIEQLLLTVNPQKPLTEIALDADLPLHVALDIASFLVLRRVCVASEVVSLHSRLACVSTNGIPELLLDFSQAFPGISLFGVISFLTNSTSLGHNMTMLTDDENFEGVWVREMLMSSPSYQHRVRKLDKGNAVHRGRATGTMASSMDKMFMRSELSIQDEFSSLHRHVSSQTASVTQENSLRNPQWTKDLEEFLFSIAVWLLSHRIITHMQDYIVLVDEMESFWQKQATNSADPDELLFKELLDLGYLNGDLTIAALSLRLGMNHQKLKAWGLRHRSVNVLTRVPRTMDDPAAPSTSLLPVQLKSNQF